MADAQITSAGTHARIKLTKREARALHDQAAALGIDPQELMQRSFDAFARKRFPDAFAPKDRR